MIGDVWWLLWSYDSEGCVPLITSSIQLCSTSHDMYDRLPNWLAELPLVPKVLIKSCIGFWSLTRVCSACSRLLRLLWCTYVVHTSSITAQMKVFLGVPFFLVVRRERESKSLSFKFQIWMMWGVERAGTTFSLFHFRKRSIENFEIFVLRLHPRMVSAFPFDCF